MEARALALVLAPGGTASAASGDSCWLVADTALEDFGNEVPDSVLSDPLHLRCDGAVGIAQLDDDWVFVEKVMRSDIGIWKDETRVGPGRDARLSTTTRDARQRRYTDLASAITDLKEIAIDDWVFRGPRAIVEVLDAIRASGQGMLGYQEFWINSSGVTPDHSVVHHHRDVLGIIFLALQVDHAAQRLQLHVHGARRAPALPNAEGHEAQPVEPGLPRAQHDDDAPPRQHRRRGHRRLRALARGGAEE